MQKYIQSTLLLLLIMTMKSYNLSQNEGIHVASLTKDGGKVIWPLSLALVKIVPAHESGYT